MVKVGMSHFIVPAVGRLGVSRSRTKIPPSLRVIVETGLVITITIRRLGVGMVMRSGGLVSRVVVMVVRRSLVVGTGIVVIP